MSSGKQFVNPDGREISYEISNFDPTGPQRPLVLLSNSLCAPYRTWDRVVTFLHENGASVLRYDQPGHGRSSLPQDLKAVTFKTLAKDVADLLKSLDISKVDVWIGVSMGAATGAYFAYNNPGIVKTLVMCDCPTSFSGLQNVFGARVVAARNDGNMDAQVDIGINRWFSEDWRTTNPEELKRVRSIMRTTKVDGFEACINALVSESFDLNLITPELGKCVKSVVVVVGELDMNLPQTMDTLREKIQQGFNEHGNSEEVNLHILKGAGHVCYIDNFDAFSNVIAKIIRY